MINQVSIFFFFLIVEQVQTILSDIMRSFSHSKHEIRAERIELQNFFGYSKVAVHRVFQSIYLYEIIILA